ncbi:MAG TPA: VanZ family protein [Ferruginibacter sp.]|nr:VanZ family protein [Ferruginibacter sp.]
MKDKQVPYAGSPIIKFIPGIAWFFLVLTLCCIPGFDLPKVDNWLIEINFDKLVHVGLFAVLAYLFMYPLVKMNLSGKERWYYIIKITIATIVWGFTVELIQKFFIPGRSFTLGDCIADGLGGIIAVLFYKKRFSETLKS